MINNKPHFIEYMCTYCGRKQVQGASMGRPQPGICPRRNGSAPHSWVKNRER